MDAPARLRAWLRRRTPTLRGQLIAAQMAVVLVGVVTLLGTLEWLLRTTDPALWEALPSIASGERPAALLSLLRQLSFQALLVAALAASVTGLVTSLLLTGALLRPLHALGRSSSRIARGHYGERVAEPDSSELATVAQSFNRMAATLEQIEQQRVALIGNVMHELRTPLTALGGYLEGMLDGVIPADEASFRQMDREVRRLQRLVTDLEELSRVEAGQLRLELHPFDLNEVARQVVARLAPQARSKGLRLLLDLAPSSLPVRADADRTTQVLINLVGNAIRYTPEGGAISVMVSARDAVAEIEVADSGIGIDADALPLLFERFYRVDRSRNRRTGGSGIGLTIARHLAWAMGGDVVAESLGPGQGSTFRLTLPRAP